MGRLAGDTPKRVGAQCGALRRELLGPRYRPVSEKKLALFIRAVEGRNRGLSWTELMKE